MPFPDGLKGSSGSTWLAPAVTSATMVKQAAGAAGASAAGFLPYLGPVASVLGIGAQMYTNYKNRKLQEEINARQERLIREQNAYNSPVAQMARYKAAGLNPLAFMNNIGSGNQEAVAALGTPQYESPDFGQVGDAIQNSLAYRLQAKQTEQLEKLRASQTQLNSVRTANIEQVTEQAAETFGLKKEMLQGTIDNLAKDLSVKDAQIMKYYTSANVDRNQISEIYARCNNLYASSAAYRAQVNYYAQLTGIAAWQVKYMDAFYTGYMGEIVDADHKIRFANRDAAIAAAKAATAEAFVAEETKGSRVKYASWSAEKMRTDAGQSWDMHQQGMALNWSGIIVPGATRIFGTAAGMYGATHLGASPAFGSFSSPMGYDFGQGTGYGTFYEPM